MSSQSPHIYVMRELLETERTFVKCLTQLKQFFFAPAINHFQQEGSGEMDPELRELMQQTDVILKINKQFLEELEKRIGKQITNNSRISDILSKYSQMFKIYVAYLDIQANGSASYLRLSRRYENLKQESIRLQKEFGVSVDFESLVITPMQRILRYIMLVKEILKHMPQQNIEREGLEEALHNLESTANFINNHLVDKKSKQRMIELSTYIDGITDLLQPSRSLVNEGSLMKINRNSTDQRYLVLFSDLLLICTQKKNIINLFGRSSSSSQERSQNRNSESPGRSQQYKLNTQIDLHIPIKCIDCGYSKDQPINSQPINSQQNRGRSPEKQSSESRSNKNSNKHKLNTKTPRIRELFLLLTPQRTFLFEATNLEEKQEWINLINNTRFKIKQQQQQLKNKSIERSLNSFKNSDKNECELLDKSNENNYSDIENSIDDESLEIISPPDPLLWIQLLSHMNIDWDKLKHYKDEVKEKNKENNIEQELKREENRKAEEEIKRQKIENKKKKQEIDEKRKEDKKLQQIEEEKQKKQVKEIISFQQ